MFTEKKKSRLRKFNQIPTVLLKLLFYIRRCKYFNRFSLEIQLSLPKIYKIALILFYHPTIRHKMKNWHIVCSPTNRQKQWNSF